MEKAFEIKRFALDIATKKLIKKYLFPPCPPPHSVQRTMLPFARPGTLNPTPAKHRPTLPAPVNDLQSESLQPAPLKSRLLAMVYEAMLLFGVLFISTWLFSTLLQQRHALYLRDNLQYWLFLVLGMYFCWFWRHGGQTLAMKTWRIRLLTREGGILSWKHAVARYVLAWLWFVPGLATARYLHVQGWMLLLLPALNMALWALAVFLDRDRQFPHDRFAGTRIVQLPPIAPIEKAAEKTSSSR